MFFLGTYGTKAVSGLVNTQGLQKFPLFNNESN